MIERFDSSLLEGFNILVASRQSLLTSLQSSRYLKGHCPSYLAGTDPPLMVILVDLALVVRYRSPQNLEEDSALLGSDRSSRLPLGEFRHQGVVGSPA